MEAEGSRILQCDHYILLDSYNQIVKGYLRETDFYYVFQIGIVQYQSALVNALIERWHHKTHMFHFSVGEYAVMLEDVAIILDLPTNDLPVTGLTLNNYEALEAECLDQFGVAPRKTECRGSFIKLTWFRGLKDHLVLADDIHIQSWGSTCLAHLYRALCRVTRVNCKEIDGLLTLLLTRAWIRLPFLAPIPGNLRLFPIANRWRNWEHADHPYRFRSLVHFRRALDNLQE
ncbi:protein MAIN-LIKE 2-like [Arachis duranensis]|uniref:Protein MAIN-LIKE 2-like n=1 Tax=Arachis duranensis TaxID=130453 RepID=A0A6P4DJC8_ARADU|nr:protein MAIN-LIKE 2-like [Arachis duranensis]